jgi:two-component system response regulator PrrA
MALFDDRAFGVDGRSVGGGLAASRLPQPVVLVVDDDADIAASIADVLRTGGYDVALAADGHEAVAVAERAAVGLVLLDWRLPNELAGSVLVRRLRELRGSALPIVVLSADPVALTEARVAQVSDYLPKPFEIADLLHLVDEFYVG